MKACKVWNKVNPGTTDLHGNPILQKYATEDAVVTITKNTKRVETWNAPPTLQYSGNAITTQHLHH